MLRNRRSQDHIGNLPRYFLAKIVTSTGTISNCTVILLWNHFKLTRSKGSCEPLIPSHIHVHGCSFIYLAFQMLLNKLKGRHQSLCPKIVSCFEQY